MLIFIYNIYIISIDNGIINKGRKINHLKINYEIFYIRFKKIYEAILVI